MIRKQRTPAICRPLQQQRIRRLCNFRNSVLPHLLNQPYVDATDEPLMRTRIGTIARFKASDSSRDLSAPRCGPAGMPRLRVRARPREQQRSAHAQIVHVLDSPPQKKKSG
jgi:hypothetical protein